MFGWVWLFGAAHWLAQRQPWYLPDSRLLWRPYLWLAGRAYAEAERRGAQEVYR